MVVMLVAGMSDLAWMVIVATIVLLYKVVPHRRVQDTGIALTMLPAGIWLVAFPASAPMLLMPNGHA
jgi:predicted metal-binding membrane protein